MNNCSETGKIIGILESKSDRFVSDVVSQLNDIPVEYISTAGERLPVERDYRVIVDRLSFRYPFLKELMKSLSLRGTYVINNPFTASSTNKLMEIVMGSRLNLPFPGTILLPDRSVCDETDGLVSPPALEQVVAEIGLPCVLKPYDGYAWEDVYVIRSIEELRDTYNAHCGRRTLMAQQMVRYREYYRTFCFDKRNVLFIKWIPKPQSMGQYLYCDSAIPGNAEKKLTELTVQLNYALDLDVNVVEWCIDDNGKWWIIDAFNEVPEIIPEALPHDYYRWIVGRFASCVRDKVSTGKINRVPFDLSHSLHGVYR